MPLHQPRFPSALGAPDLAVGGEHRPAPDPGLAEPPPTVIWHPAHRANRIQANRPQDHPILWLLLYLSGRPTLDSIRTYRLVPTGCACHFLISGAGETVQMLSERDWTPLTGVRSIDQQSILIEVEAEAGVVGEAAYRAAGALVQQLAQQFGVPLERSRVLGAHEVTGTRIADAPVSFDWNRLLSCAIVTAPIKVDATIEGRFFASSGWTRMATSDQRRGTFFAVAPAGADGDDAEYRVRFPHTGLYAVSVWYPSSPDACPATPLLLSTPRGRVQVLIDQREGGGRWQGVGTFPFQAGDYWAASISRGSSAKGAVVADSIQFEPINKDREGWAYPSRSLS